ncbi:MAG TPA: serine hydrolase domain-containing protein [Mycobacteriales bacterium]
MSRIDEVSAWISRRLPDLLAEHRVPAAAVAVSVGGEIVDHAAGVLNMVTGVEATVDSVFQIGSITKVWTATLVMQLVDEGRLDLDAPVRVHLPGFRLVDDAAAGQITARQLLSHTAGFEGDLLHEDTGPGDDCVERFVASLDQAPQVFPPGQMFSYNNAGYTVLGRLVEVLRGMPYDECLRRYLVTPLGLTHTAPGPHEAIMYRAAHGHIQPTADAQPQPAPIWALPRSGSPAGSLLAMRPRDLLSFVHMHLRGGRATPHGPQVLTSASATAMRRRQVELRYLGGFGDAWGLGWEIFDWPGGTVIGHDGETVGQNAYLRVVPDRDIAVALLANGGSPRGLYVEIFGHVLRELAGVELPPFPEPVAGARVGDVSRYLGMYTSSLADTIVSQDPNGRIWADWTPKGLYAELGGAPERHELVALDGDTLASAEKQNGRHRLFTFVGADASGHALFLHNGRADRWAGPA